MNNAVGYTALIACSCLVFCIAGCRTVDVPASPSHLKYQEIDKPLSVSTGILEAEFIAEKLAEQKKKIPPSVSKKPKIADPVWNSVRKLNIDTKDPLTLIELVDIALANNPDTRQSWGNTRVARALEKQKEGKLYPQITTSMTLTREKTVATLPISNVNDLEYGPSTKLTYLLLDFGGRKANIEQAFQGILSADSLYNQAIQDLLLSVEKNYYQLYSAQSKVEASEDDVKNTKEDFEAAEQRFEAGLVTKLDVLQAKSDYENSLYSLENSKGQVKSARATLAQSIGIPADTEFEIVIPSKIPPTGISEEDVSAIIEDAIVKRPDIASLRAELKSKEAAVKSAVSDLLPTLNLGGTAEANKYKYYNDPASGTKKRDNSYTAYASVDWDVFDGFYNINKKVQADRELDIARDKLIQKQLSVSADVWIKYYDFYTAVSKFAYSESFFDTARISYELALESYNAGLKSILDLLQSQSRLSEARSRFIQSKEDVFISLAELAHARGSVNGKIEKRD
ncbi:MAG: TolC family protein [Candidatus Omnitrophica bacterium]|nr:TolC family protein [Candidatus Omnitrophota bacterium]